MSSGKRICIIGLGLIGGSLALALKDAEPSAVLVGFDVDALAVAKAVDMGAIDIPAKNLAEAVKDSHIVFLCTPIPVILRTLGELADLLSPGCIVTDVGSTKAGIVNKALEVLPSDAYFVGGHPMAGSEKGGIQAADPYLFENAIYVLSAPPETPCAPVECLETLVRQIGARPLRLSPEHHDHVVAAISHLPHLVASALAGAVARLAGEDAFLVDLAAGGFRDTTRIASGNSVLWNGILMSNRDQVLSAIDGFLGFLDQLKSGILDRDPEEVKRLLEEAAVFRKSLPRAGKGLLSGNFELTVRVVDEPGMLSKITSLLASVDVNIMDIEILRIREGEGGALRLAVPSEECLHAALKILQANGYGAWPRQ